MDVNLLDNIYLPIFIVDFNLQIDYKTNKANLLLENLKKDQKVSNLSQILTKPQSI